jgi:hypothetical protein
MKKNAFYKNKLLFSLVFLIPNVAFNQIEFKTLVKRDNFKVKYYQNDKYIGLVIESKYTPFIYTDINGNNITDPYIDKLYSVIDGNSLCVSNQLENKATTTCGQSTHATLIANENNYHFVIPKKELSYTPSKPIYLSFGGFDKNSAVLYLINNNNKSFIITD